MNLQSKTHIFTSFFILFLSINLYTQETPEPPIEWEEIPVEDLKMTSCAADTTASALVLCDYGFTTFNNDLHLVFEKHMRIKIFNENGYRMASFAINIREDDEEYYDEKLDDVEGITYWLNDQGEIEEAELDEDDILEENVSENYIAYKFTMPALKPGCIIDVRYKIITHNIVMVRDWNFQYSEPVLWSEFRMLYLKNIGYSFVTRGYEPFYIDEIISTTRVISGTASSYIHNSIAQCNLLRMVVKDAPAIRDEPFITCTDDYKNKVEIQLAGYAVPGQSVKTVSTTWSEFLEETLEYEYSDDQVDISDDVRDLAAELTRGISDPEEKIKAVYNWVSKSVVWSGKNSANPQQTPANVIEQKKGNSADINILLIALLRSLEIECYPVIVSTRSNGRIQDLYPIAHQFNYVIARAKAKAKYFYLDATNPFRPYDLLPSKILSVKALVIKEGPVEWTTLRCEKKNTTTTLVKLNIEKDGTLKGYIEQSLGEYKSIDIRSDFAGSNEKEIIKKIYDTEFYGLEIDSLSVTNKDSIQNPLRIFTSISSDQYAQVSGDLIYLNPNMVFRLKENPFKSAKRKYPVDYAYKNNSTTIINIKIPENLQVKELIKNKFVNVAGVTYTRKVVQEGNEIQITCKFDIKETEVKPSDYEKLRDMYSLVLSCQSEQIVLSKKAS